MLMRYLLFASLLILREGCAWNTLAPVCLCVSVYVDNFRVSCFQCSASFIVVAVRESLGCLAGRYGAPGIMLWFSSTCVEFCARRWARY